MATAPDLDPEDALTGEPYEDPNPEPITDPEHPDYIEPALGIPAFEED